jgi:hypothetical protein
MNRSILVDNNAASIFYSGPWVASERGLLSPGTLGTPSYSNTIHMITTTGSFKYPFRGKERLFHICMMLIRIKIDRF